MVIELELSFKDTFVNEAGETEAVDPMRFVHTLAAPEGMDITGGQIFVENPTTSDLQRFTFRIDRSEETGMASLTILEDVRT